MATRFRFVLHPLALAAAMASADGAAPLQDRARVQEWLRANGYLTRDPRGPSLEELSEEMAGKVKIAKLNIDENPELAAQFGVRSIPTLAVFKGGEVADIKVGAAPKTALSSWIAGAA